MQTDSSIKQESAADYVVEEVEQSKSSPVRDLDECLRIYKSELGASSLTDQEVIMLVKNKYIPAYQIEKAVNDPERGVGIRRQIVGVEGSFTDAFTDLPYRNYDYSKVSRSKICLI